MVGTPWSLETGDTSSQGGGRPSVWAVVVAAGTGHRFGEPKQFSRLAGHRVVDWSIAALAPSVAGVVVALPPDRPGECVAPPGTELVTVAGGATRSASVRAALAAVPAAAEIVIVHDAARPLASTDLVARVVAAVEEGADAVVPAVPVVDTIRHRDGGVVDRSALVAVQTPQGFRCRTLRRAHRDDPEATDDATLVEDAGGTVVVVPGESTNLKLTEPTDLVVAEALLAYLGRSAPPSGAGP